MRRGKGHLHKKWGNQLEIMKVRHYSLRINSILNSGLTVLLEALVFIIDGATAKCTLRRWWFKCPKKDSDVNDRLGTLEPVATLGPWFD